jgi:Arc/MetJ-type ribon-helix-helix transcriptional regulator
VGIPKTGNGVTTAGSITEVKADFMDTEAERSIVRAYERLSARVSGSLGSGKSYTLATALVRAAELSAAASEQGDEASTEPRDEERPAARARKVSVSMPEDLTAAVQERVGRGEFSRYVTEAVARRLELDLLADLAALLEAEHGPVSEAALAEADAAWPDGD